MNVKKYINLPKDICNLCLLKIFLFLNYLQTIYLVFTKNIHENSVGKTFFGCSYHLNDIKEYIYIFKYDIHFELRFL